MREIWKAQIKRIDGVLSRLSCCDGEYRGYPGRPSTLITMVDPMVSCFICKDFAEKLKATDFYYAPASTCHHGAFDCGLLTHSLLVAKRLLELSVNNDLNWTRSKSPFIVGLLHDMCKVFRYEPDGYDGYTYTKAIYMPIPGHAERSIAIINTLGLSLTEEEMLCIRYHMGAYETKEWQMYENAIKLYPNVLWTHTADMYASKIDGV